MIFMSHIFWLFAALDLLLNAWDTSPSLLKSVEINYKAIFVDIALRYNVIKVRGILEGGTLYSVFTHLEDSV